MGFPNRWGPWEHWPPEFLPVESWGEFAASIDRGYPMKTDGTMTDQMPTVIDWTPEERLRVIEWLNGLLFQATQQRLVDPRTQLATMQSIGLIAGQGAYFLEMNRQTFSDDGKKLYQLIQAVKQ